MAIYGRILSLLNALAGLSVVALMLLISADVASRSLLNQPIYGVPELTKLAIVVIVWLQMAYTLYTHRHIRTTFILFSLPPQIRVVVELVNCLFGVVLMGMIAYYSVPELLRAWSTGAFEGERPLRIPVWPVWTAVLAGSGLMLMEFARQAILICLCKQVVVPAEIHPELKD